MKGERKAVIGFAALLICTTGVILSSETRAPSAKVQFTEARLATNGSLAVSYSYTLSPHASLHETEFLNGKKAGEMIGGGEGSGSANSNVPLQASKIPHPFPSMLVTTGRTYYLKLHERLAIYSFTNTSGTTYRAELSLESP